MILGSHNSWSYLRPSKWYLRPLAFTARCQRKDIRTQYSLGVRCFDLRIRTDKDGNPRVRHGLFQYDITPCQLAEHLAWLNTHTDVCIRLIHEVRTKRQYTPTAIAGFQEFCHYALPTFPNIRFWCFRNLYNWLPDFPPSVGCAAALPQPSPDPSCLEKYSSVCPPRIIDDWLPILYARLHNRKILQQGTDKDILLIDFADIQ